MKKLIAMGLVLTYILTAYSVAYSPYSTASWEDGRFHPVDSPVFDAAKYEGSTDTLTLLFRSGEAYEYYGVSRRTFHTFMRTNYKGSFFNAHIRRAYCYRHVGMAP